MKLNEIDFSTVSNRNEKKVLKALGALLEQENIASHASILTEKDFQDIYALALNRLPSRYCQESTIVLGDPVRESDVNAAVLDAFETVINRPKN